MRNLKWDIAVGPGNVYHVPKRQWRKWPNAARALYNGLMDDAAEQELIASGAKVDEQDWFTIRWNLAYLAADLLAKMQKGVDDAAR